MNDSNTFAQVDPPMFDSVIHAYTRAEALADGVLVDVSEVGREAGFRFPVALTQAVHADCVAWADADNQRKGTVQDEAGRLWDVIWMASLAARRPRNGEGVRSAFRVARVPRTGRARMAREVVLEIVIGPGDEGEPVVTIQRRGED